MSGKKDDKSAAFLPMGMGVGIAVGTLAAVKRDGLLDYSSLSITLIGVSLPSFVTAAVLLLFFAPGPLLGAADASVATLFGAPSALFGLTP